MEYVNIHQAKTNLSKLIERVQQGEESVISKAGKPVAKLSGLAATAGPRKLGCLKGKFEIPADFDNTFPKAILESFEGREE